MERTMTESQARATLGEMVQASSEPILGTEEVDALMPLARRSDIAGNRAYPPWESETAYGVGERAVPAPRNGHIYVVATEGETAAEPPTWPTDSEATVTDGTVVWQEAGQDLWVPTFDLNAAAAEGWRRKAGKVVPAYSFEVDGQTSHQSQVYEHCLQQAAYYESRRTRSIGVA